METLGLVESFQEFKEFKNIDREKMMRVLEDVFRSMILKKYGSDDNFDIIINIDKGDLEVWRNRIIVEDGEVEDENKEIAYSQAIKIEPDFEVGEEVSEEVKLLDFGRRAVLSVRQNLISKVLDLEKDDIYKKYSERVGNVVTGEVYQVWKREVMILDDEENELILPKTEQIPTDFYKKGDSVRAVVLKVEMRNNNPQIILSRSSPVFLERLFEAEVPEVYDGLITIKKVVRVPGERAKVAVESYDERIDPVGACVGMKGSRIHGIVRELGNENIDVINFSENLSVYVTRALSPAKVTSVKFLENERRIEVFLKPDQVSLAIGKGGHNIKLAGKLVGYEIEVYRDTAEEIDDVKLEEFSDEIESWVINQLKSVGLDTAKSVLELSREDLMKRADLEEETVDAVIDVLKEEFED